MYSTGIYGQKIYIHTTLVLMVFGKIKLHKQRTQACRKGKIKYKSVGWAHIVNSDKRVHQCECQNPLALTGFHNKLWRSAR